MKIYKFVALCILFIFAVGALAACGGSADPEEALVGRWVSDIVDDQWYQFRANGTGAREIPPFAREDFDWEVVGGNVIMQFDTHDEVWGFTIRRNTVTFTDTRQPDYVFPFSRE